LAYRFVLHADQKVACFRFHDVLSVTSARQAFVDYVAHPDFDPGYTMLSDARDVTKIDASFISILTAVQGLSAHLSKFDKGAMSVVLVSNSTTFGMVRMLEQVLDFASRIKMRIAWTEDEALTIAGLTDADFARLFDF
jgi:hypothetical protein